MSLFRLKIKLFTLIFFFSFTALGFDFSSQGYRRLIDESDGKKAELLWLRSHMSSFVQGCLLDENFCGESENIQYFSELSVYLERSSSSLIFVEQENAPISFDLGDQTHRVAITALAPNSPIYINSDRINNLDASGWLGVLVHEMFHHLGYLDDPERTLDRLGRVAQDFFKANSQMSTLGSLGSDESKVLMYVSHDINIKILFQYNSPLNQDNRLSSIDLGFDEPVEKCTENDLDLVLSPRTQGFLFQPVQSASFLNNELRVLASNRVSYSCVDSDSLKTHDMAVDINFAFFLIFNNAEDLSQGVQHAEASFDPLKVTFDTQHVGSVSESFFNNLLYRIESVEYSAEQVLAGETLSVSATLYSRAPLDNMTCVGLYTSPDYPYDIIRERFLFLGFDGCQLEKMNGVDNRYRVSLSINVDESFRASQIRLQFIQFQTMGQSVYAFSNDVKLVSLGTVGAVSPLQIKGLEVKGDVIKSSLLNQPWAFRTEPNNDFTLEFTLEGNQSVEHIVAEISLFVEIPGQQAYALGLYVISGAGPIFKDYSVEEIDGDEKLVRLNFNYVPEREGLEILGIQINRITFFTSDAHFVEFNSPDILGVFFFTNKLEEFL